jgi:glycosyltransferase involved in cell wall biosynthesis
MTWLLQTYWITRVSFTCVAEDIMRVLSHVKWERGDFMLHTPWKPYDGVLYVGSFMNIDIARYWRYVWWTDKHVYYGVMEGPPAPSPFNLGALHRMTVIVPSNYVKWELERIGVRVADVIPHGVDVQVFRSTPRDNQWRRLFGGRILVLYVAHRHVRKGFQQLCEAWRRSRAGRDPNVVLVLHTSRTPNRLSGEHFIIPEEGNIMVTDNVLKLSRSDLIMLYRAADLYIHGALAEGFGIPVAEAIAAGTPVLTLDAPPMNELNIAPEARVRVAGQVIHYDANGTAYRLNIPDMDDYAEKIDQLVYDEKLRREIAEKQAEKIPEIDLSVYRRFEKWVQ